jgi:hypothetical protein
VIQKRALCHGMLIAELVWEPLDGVSDEPRVGTRLDIEQLITGARHYPLAVTLEVEDDGVGSLSLSAADASRFAAALMDAADQLDTLAAATE